MLYYFFPCNIMNKETYFYSSFLCTHFHSLLFLHEFSLRELAYLPQKNFTSLLFPIIAIFTNSLLTSFPFVTCKLALLSLTPWHTESRFSYSAAAAELNNHSGILLFSRVSPLLSKLHRSSTSVLLWKPFTKRHTTKQLCAAPFFHLFLMSPVPGSYYTYKLLW